MQRFTKCTIKKISGKALLLCPPPSSNVVKRGNAAQSPHVTESMVLSRPENICTDPNQYVTSHGLWLIDKSINDG
ncbi:hypothetical protein GWI33_017465 [Rhynchophorus ferrugineus]|uniref:Uncharacterized protein n=1 Tax=Rhynchophorus ferrugineus TaxID=354439 RepID=A0A834HY63_RHYFE|nr:hypothetical protein GWI33_017465 [Rhynchophorus ferrugineus]